MNALLAPLADGLNTAADALGRTLLAPVSLVPGWLSATLVAAVTGILLLFVFKHTSNQRAIKRVRDDLDANLLALKLFKESTAVTFRAQARMIVGALRLMFLALVPMLFMALPVTLFLGQMALWYQSRPLHVGEEAVVTLALAGDAGAPWPNVTLRPHEAIGVTVGPVRVRSRREICWTVAGRHAGEHRLTFDVDGQPVTKTLAVGNAFMRVSPLRPGWDWRDILLNPAEAPLRPDSPVRSIAVEFPRRASWTSGTDAWVIYWGLVSMGFALVFRRPLGVNV